MTKQASSIEMVTVPAYMLWRIKQYFDAEPKEFSAMPTRVRMALQDVVEYLPSEKQP